jgi:hypothetical protein
VSGRSARPRASVGGTAARRMSALQVQAWRKYEASTFLPTLVEVPAWVEVQMRLSGHLVRIPLADGRESACRVPDTRSRQTRYAVGVGSVGGGRRRRVARLGVRVNAAAGDRWEEAPLPPPHVHYISSVTNPYVKHCVKLKKRCGPSPLPLLPPPTRNGECHRSQRTACTFRYDECTPGAVACRRILSRAKAPP